eukprot:g3347.t1
MATYGSTRARSSGPQSFTSDEDHFGEPASGAVASNAMITEKMDEKLRKGFARKVMGLTGVMLVLCFSIMGVVKVVGRTQVTSVAFEECAANKGSSDSCVKDKKTNLEKLKRYSAMFMVSLGEEKDEGSTSSSSGNGKNESREEREGPEDETSNEHMKTPSTAYMKKLDDKVSSLQRISMILFVIGAVLGLPLYCVVMCGCCGSLPKKTPCNYILCFAIAFLWGLQLQGTCFLSAVSTIFLAIGVTAVTVLALYFLSLCCVDLTGCGVWFFMIAIGLVVLSTLISVLNCSGCVHLGGGKGSPMDYISIGITIAFTLLTMVYILYAFQLIVGGKHRKAQFSIDDHAFAAIFLFVEIYNLFIELLALLSRFGGK